MILFIEVACFTCLFMYTLTTCYDIYFPTEEHTSDTKD